MAHFSIQPDDIPDDTSAKCWLVQLGAGPGDTIRIVKSRRIGDAELMQRVEEGIRQGISLSKVRVRISVEFGYRDDRSLRRRISHLLQGATAYSTPGESNGKPTRQRRNLPRQLILERSAASKEESR